MPVCDITLFFHIVSQVMDGIEGGISGLAAVFKSWPHKGGCCYENEIQRSIFSFLHLDTRQGDSKNEYCFRILDISYKNCFLIRKCKIWLRVYSYTNLSDLFWHLLKQFVSTATISDHNDNHSDMGSVNNCMWFHHYIEPLPFYVVQTYHNTINLYSNVIRTLSCLRSVNVCPRKWFRSFIFLLLMYRLSA